MLASAIHRQGLSFSCFSRWKHFPHPLTLSFTLIKYFISNQWSFIHWFIMFCWHGLIRKLNALVTVLTYFKMQIPCYKYDKMQKQCCIETQPQCLLLWNAIHTRSYAFYVYDLLPFYVVSYIHYTTLSKNCEICKTWYFFYNWVGAAFYL